MARRVKQSVMDQAGISQSQEIRQSVDLKKGTRFMLPTNQRSIIFLFFEFGLFFAAGLAMWPVDQTIAIILFIVAVGLPAFMYYYDGRSTPRSVVVYDEKLVLYYKFKAPVTISWNDIEYLQKIEVFDRFSSKSRPLGWMKAKTMRVPVILSNKAGDAAIYAYTLKIGVAPPTGYIKKKES